MKIPKKIDIIGIGISQTSINDVIVFIEKFLKNKNNKKGYITVTGAHGIIESTKSNYIEKIHNQSLLSIPDGMPLVWISKIKGSKTIARCFGPQVMLELIKKTQNKNIKHFFYGGKSGIANELKDKMLEKFPNSKIVGTFTPPFRELNSEEESKLISCIENCKPDIIWVGLSTPKQEIFMYEYINKLNTKLMMGVGAAFDYHTEKIVIAPRFIQNAGLEWLFRLIIEPKRLFKRYLEIVPKFIYFSVLDLLKNR
tara:strand:+ start:1241 stop:2002 length:762 start_codon:yes stop_codon:yes gene_type:complete